VIPLRDSANTANAIETARNAGFDAGNKGNVAGFSTDRVLANYRDWAQQAERLLGNVFTRDAVDDLVRTQRFWTLQSATGEEPLLISMVLAELAERRQAMEDLVTQLCKVHARWCQAGFDSIAVADTNMFLRAEAPFEEVDWLGTVGGSALRLVLPIAVVHELDRLKRQGNNTTQSMARQSLRWLYQNLPRDPAGRTGELAAAPGVTVEVFVHDGPTRSPDVDALTIDVARWLGIVSDVPVKLVTRDLGMRLRAQTIGVHAVQLPDD